MLSVQVCCHVAWCMRLICNDGNICQLGFMLGNIYLKLRLALTQNSPSLTGVCFSQCAFGGMSLRRLKCVYILLCVCVFWGICDFCVWMLLRLTHTHMHTMKPCWKALLCMRQGKMKQSRICRWLAWIKYSGTFLLSLCVCMWGGSLHMRLGCWSDAAVREYFIQITHIERNVCGLRPFEKEK